MSCNNSQTIADDSLSSNPQEPSTLELLIIADSKSDAKNEFTQLFSELFLPPQAVEVFLRHISGPKKIYILIAIILIIKLNKIFANLIN